MNAPMSDASSGSSDDLSALAWVHEELRRSLDSAHKALRRFVGMVVTVGWITPEIIAAFIFAAFFAKNGTLNVILGLGGIKPISWLFAFPMVSVIIANIWKGTAADLAARDRIAVVPTYGWWNKRPNLEGYIKASHYALIVTIRTPATDIYTPVATQVGVPIVIET